MAREFSIIVYGATGFTGRLVAEYLAADYPALSWAMAGRSLAKLEEVRAAIGAPATLPLVTADASDPASLAALANRADVILTTVGPYQLYGSDLVAACAAAGTAYVDLCGEPAWMREDDRRAPGPRQGERRAHRLFLRLQFDPVRSRRAANLQKLCVDRLSARRRRASRAGCGR